LFILVGFLVVMLAAIRWIPTPPIIAYSATFISSSILYWFICRRSLSINQSSEGLLAMLVVLVLLRASFIGTKPLGSDDVYRYEWDGRVQSAGINPYAFTPEDAALSDLHTQNLPSLVNHPDLKTLYFPLCEWIFYLGYNLSDERVWGVQLFILLAEILTLYGLVVLMREHSYSPWRALIYAANPLIILQFSLDAHVDALGFPLLVFGFLFYHRGKKTAAFFLLGLSMLIKPVALVLLPILVLHEQGLMNKVKALLIPLCVLLIPFIPYAIHANPFEGLATFSRNWFFNGALFSLLLPFFDDNQNTRFWCFLVLVVVLGVLYASRRSFNEKIVFSVLFLLLCSPVAHPWYIGWLILLLPLTPVSSGLALAGTASLPSITFVTYQLAGIWKDYPLVLILEYIPVVLLLYFNLRGTTQSPDDREELYDGESPEY
jgi:hypothetical protein